MFKHLLICFFIPLFILFTIVAYVCRAYEPLMALALVFMVVGSAELHLWLISRNK